jgi:hypothetical protein
MTMHKYTDAAMRAFGDYTTDFILRFLALTDREIKILETECALDGCNLTRYPDLDFRVFWKKFVESQPEYCQPYRNWRRDLSAEEWGCI